MGSRWHGITPDFSRLYLHSGNSGFFPSSLVYQQNWHSHKCYTEFVSQMQSKQSEECCNNSSTFPILWISWNMTELWAKVHGNVEAFLATESCLSCVQAGRRGFLIQTKIPSLPQGDRFQLQERRLCLSILLNPLTTQGGQVCWASEHNSSSLPGGWVSQGESPGEEN